MHADALPSIMSGNFDEIVGQWYVGSAEGDSNYINLARMPSRYTLGDPREIVARGACPPSCPAIGRERMEKEESCHFEELRVWRRNIGSRNQRSVNKRRPGADRKNLGVAHRNKRVSISSVSASSRPNEVTAHNTSRYLRINVLHQQKKANI